jgi:hypothetical protein
MQTLGGQGSFLNALLLALKLQLFNNIVQLNRDRAKMFSEALSRFNKDFPNINSKKRARSENFSTDRSSFTLSDRPVLGPNIGKIGIHGHAVTGSFEHDQQKLEERTKTAVPNKRTRTSLVDVKVFLVFCAS